jgi:hypothetical protein
VRGSMGYGLRCAEPAEDEEVTDEQMTDVGWVGTRGTRAQKMSPRLVFVRGALMPEVISIEYRDGEYQSALVCARIEVRSGEPRLVELRLSSDAPTGVDQRDLSWIDSAKLVEVVVHAVSVPLSLDESGAPSSIEGVRAPMDALVDLLRGLIDMKVSVRRLRARPRTITREFLEQVAATYKSNINHAPTQAVEQFLGVSPRAAAGYVQRARREGLLPATTRGRKQA